MNENLVREFDQRFGENKIRYVGATLIKSELKLVVRFISSFAVDSAGEEAILAILRKYIPQSFENIELKITKIVALDEFVKSSVVDYLKDNHLIAFSGVTVDEVVIARDEFINVKLLLESTVYTFFTKNNVADELRRYLEKNYVDKFAVTAEDVGKSELSADILSRSEDDETPPDVYYRRTFEVEDVTRLFDNDATKKATYIVDTINLLGSVYLAGTITNIKEKTTVKDKPFFIIEFTDTTGVVSGAIFPNKDKLPKMKKLDVGSEIIVRGDFELRGEYRNLRIMSINYCIFPKNFVIEERPKKPVPKNYVLIKPEPVVLETQDNFLNYKTIPECFIGRKFVVFDFETTGTDFDDKITEIGAVKIVDGVIKESFTSLINPHKHIPTKVTELTGIDDDMVADAPDWSEVCPDFYKFCQDATLVAHNIDFDARFLKNQSEPLDYRFDNFRMDTLAIARDTVNGLANYKLNTLCEHFDIQFRHHRALSDALATGELFIELIRIKGKLPF